MFPKDWTVEKLSDLSVDGINNGTFFDPKKTGTGYRHINIDQMYVGPRISTDGLKLLNVDDATFKKKQAQYGDIFFTRSSLVWEGIAQCNVLLDRSPDFTFDDHLMRVRPKTDIIIPQYLNEYCRTFSARKFFLTRAKRSTMTTIGQNDLGDLLVGFPPIEEQEKIAKILSTWDEAIEKLENIERALKVRHLKLRQQCFSSHEETIDLKDVVEIIYGKSPKGFIAEDGRFPIIGTSGVVGRTNSPITSDDTVVLGRKGTLDNPIHILGPCLPIDTTFWTKPKSGYQLRWVFHLTKYLDLTKYNEASGVPSLSRDNLYKIKIPNHSGETQKKTIQILDCSQSEIDKSSAICKVIQTQKQGIMQQLLTGKKRVKV